MYRSFVAMLTIFVTVLVSTSGAKTGVYPLTIQLLQSVHFLNPKGEEVIATQGIYEVSEAEAGLFLVPVEGKPAHKILVEAQENHHDEDLSWPMVVALPAEAWDKYILIFMLPEGKVLEALGSYSGVRTRTVKGISALGPKDGSAQLHQRYAKIVELEKQRLQLQQQIGSLHTQLDRLHLQKPSPERADLSQQLQFDLQQRQQDLSRINQTFSTLMKQWHDTQKTIIENLK